MSVGIEYGESEKISLKMKLAFSLGFMGSSTLSGIFNSSAVKFYTDKVFLQPGLIGLAYLIFAIWNALNDPLFGYLSDRTKTKQGRRVPYLKLMSFTYGISFILVWIPPSVSFFDQNTQTITFLYLLIFILFFDSCYTLYALVLSALLPELSLDSDERTKLSQFQVAFSIVGGVLSFLIPFIFLTGAGGKEAFQIINLMMAIIATICFFVSSFTLKERKNFQKIKESLGFVDAIKFCLKNKAFVFFIGFNFCLTLISSNVITVVLYYTQHVLHLKGFGTTLPIMIIFFGFIITYSFTPRLNHKFGARKLVLLMGTIGVIGLLLTLIPNLYVNIIAFTVVAMSVGSYTIIVNPMIADCCDEDERNTGLRREGAYFGVNALVTKPAISLGIFFITFILEYSQYIPQLTEYFSFPQSIGVEIGIRLMLGGMFAGFLAIGMIFIYFYNLDGEYLKNLKEEIKKLHGLSNVNNGFQE